MWARGYFCASTGTVTDEIVKEYIENHGQPKVVNDDFKIDSERL